MDIEKYREIQKIAKAVHSELVGAITPDSTELSITQSAVKLLQEFGITETWYHGVPAFVLLGSRSCLSISGRDYAPSSEPVGGYNLVTVDLSPMRKGVWGDCARSYFMEDGSCSLSPQSIEFIEGMRVEKALHEKMLNFVTPDTRFSELYEFGNNQIEHYGFTNLDFLGNLGHSIETDPSQRLFIDRHCSSRLGDAQFFTFEPHIKTKRGKWGFKHENIYYFDAEGKVTEL